MIRTSAPSGKATSCKIFAAIVTLGISGNILASLPHMDDSNKSTAPVVPGEVPALNQHLYPRVYQHEMIGGGTPYQLSKYHFLDAKGTSFEEAAASQSYSPETMVLRHISGRGYQSYTQQDPCSISAGVAFAGTGPVSQGGPQSVGCNIYAGHWLYKAGSRLTLAVNSTALTLRVENASKFATGQYVVIYNAPAGSFNNAEHAQVVSRDAAAGTLTLKSRGFKSTSAPHAAGSIVAQHVLAQGEDSQLWALNFSSRSPKDGNGKTWGDFYAGWLVKNLEKSKSGQMTSANVAGIVLDADFYFDMVKKESDVNNDLATDSGVSSSGENWLGIGMDQFYAWITQRAPNIYLLSGVHDGRGFDTAQGIQMESWLDYGNADFSPVPKYLQLNSVFAMYLYNAGARARGPALVHNLTKTPTKLYRGNASSTPPDNRPFRLGLAMTLMDNGYFGTHSRSTDDAWWDEYAVDVVANSPTYGRAINKSDIAGIHRHRGWLGKPLGKFTRIYSDTDFGVGRSMLLNGTFDSILNNWSTSNVDVARTTASKMDGTAALWISKMRQYQPKAYAARVRSGAVALAAGKGYTLTFSARAEKHREIVVSIGSENARIPVGPNWRRYVMGFQQNAGTSSPATFQVGREDTEVWLDSVSLFPGNANVFRRDFERGIVVANATPETRTVALGGLYRRIIGSQDPGVNSGQSVTAVTLAPYDGVLLVRPPN